MPKFATINDDNHNIYVNLEQIVYMDVNDIDATIYLSNGHSLVVPPEIAKAIADSYK